MDGPLQQTQSRQGAATTATPGVVFALVVLCIGTLFAVSDLTLESIGYSYLGSGGAFYQKLHPSTFAALAAVLLVLVRAENPLAWLTATARAWPGATAIMLFACVLQCVILLKGYPLAYAIDTFLAPAVVFVLLQTVSETRLRSLGYGVLALLIVNTGAAFAEYALGERWVNLASSGDVAGKLADSLDWRPTAIFGHPLRNALLTGLSILLLVVTALPLKARVVLVTFQVMGLLIFGGRSSIVILAALACVMAVVAVATILRGRRFGLLLIPGALGLVVTLSSAAILAHASGAFDRIIDRFEWDDSAETRVSAIRMFEQFATSDVLFGISQSRKDTLQMQYDTQFGIEIFWLAFLMDYGLILMLGLVAALVLFLRDLLRATNSNAVWAIAFFLFVISASLGLAAKGVLLSQFVALIVVFCGPGARVTPAETAHERSAGIGERSRR